MIGTKEGVVILHVDLSITAEEIAGWPGERITQFFRGIALAMAAKQGNAHVPGGTVAGETKPTNEQESK